ncbi:hypothetical protein KIN20_010303 [Parelaphostrongylus tenuis]|uniref:Mitotic-spindle organizing protein 1 n=1 Tax=Parelaphostrongylus tenuis TaxID=148309 RepID=A0AAD5QIR8_PARTN|nr:hypothetical protein KIN20_010303 [Parelaphostrongylus tenuis]
MAASRSSVSDLDLGKVMGICRCLNLSFTEEQVLAIIAVIEAGANPAALVEWLSETEKAQIPEKSADSRDSIGR